MTASPPVVAPSDEDACPRCTSPHAPGQEYCLDCGLRLPSPASGVLATLGGAWRRRVRWYPGDWIWVALALLAVAALGAAAAILATRDEEPQRTLVATTSPGVTTAETILRAPTETVTPPAPPSRTRTERRAPPPPAAPRSGRLISWPAGRSGWTIVLHSVLGRAQARRQARTAVGAGLRAGILNSSDYASLRPGYYVVFAGVYPGREQADAALETARERGYARAYVRQVSP